ncbi:MAG: stage IV sporulation protein A [Actinobacteria bacterium]|nr:stage IV sporulation protein A [Actinomycetota bacterium]
MEKFNIFEDIAQRTGGDIYIGVVGPVRTGKSTFIKKFMEMLVLPNIADPAVRDRTRDELPQSAGGRTIMTVEPKFVPDEGIEIAVREALRMRVRLVDCVGYTVDGALGYEDEAGPRMVLTPWFDHEIPFQEAAELGTRKVIADHSTIGLVITTDGTITEIPRAKYVPAEERVVGELRELGKPFIVLLNTVKPYATETMELAGELEEKYDVPVIPIDAAELSQEDVTLILEQVLYEFPVKEVDVALPKWVEELDRGHWLRAKFEAAVTEAVGVVRRLRDVDPAVSKLGSFEFVQEAVLKNMDLGTGVASVEMTARDDLFYQVLEEMTGVSIEGKHTMIRLMKEYVYAKTEYDKFAPALHEVRQTGYGIVPPSVAEMTFDEPELIKKGALFGVRLRANAPSLHIVRADIETEVTPIIGTERQGEELVQYLLDRFESDPKKLWEFDIFGKSLHDLVREGIQNKLFRMPENAQQKLQETLTRIINEGSGGLICIII